MDFKLYDPTENVTTSARGLIVIALTCEISKEVKIPFCLY